MGFLLGWFIFRGYVSFGEGIPPNGKLGKSSSQMGYVSFQEVLICRFDFEGFVFSFQEKKLF